ncbi:MAG: histidine--tRNA ligase, partial [Hyphomicrobiaceae bacterium]
IAADAEICMLAADTMEQLGFKRGDYLIRVNNRKILDGVLAGIDIDPVSPDQAGRRLTVLRALDKLDRLGIEGVRLLLGAGRKDESGDFTEGAGLADDAIDHAVRFLDCGEADRRATTAVLADIVGEDERGREGVVELRGLDELLVAAGFGDDRVVIDPSVVRGLDYYTGPVFEAELTFEVRGDDGQLVRFGSVGGGGRYDDLVARFTGQRVPATGFSFGVSRLASALNAAGSAADQDVTGPVVVLVMDHDETARYQELAQRLRSAGVRAEMYLGTSGMKAQMKYADKRGAPCVVIQGGDELAAGEVQIKDLIEGSRLSQDIADAKEWREARPAQFSVPEANLVDAVRDVLARHDRYSCSKHRHENDGSDDVG